MASDAQKQWWQEGTTYIAITFFFVLCSGSYILYREYVSAKQLITTNLADKIAVIKSVIPPESLTHLHALESDNDTSEYRALKERLVVIRTLNKDLRFVYILQMRSGNVFFVADSEPVTSPDISPAGQWYEEVGQNDRAYIEAVTQGQNLEVKVLPPSSDRWGTWATALTPLYDSNGTPFVLGIDVDYIKAQNASMTRLVLISLVLIALLLLIGATWFVLYREERLLRVKTLFMSLASHELRAPLTGIRWSAENLLREGRDIGPKERTIAESIHTSSMMLVTVINDFLQYITLEDTRHARIQKEPVALGAVVQESETLLRDMANTRGITIRVQTTAKEDEHTNVLCERSHLISAVNNVLSNAIKYSHTGGVVSLEISYPTQRKVMVKITDQGIGIDPSDMKNVFRGFYRAKNAEAHTGVGTGLGLYLAKKVIEGLHGTISVESVVGKGTSVAIVLPTVESV